MTNEIFDKIDNILNKERLAKLYALNLLDTEAEEAFDRITRLASDVLGVPVSLVSLVDINRQFFKSQIGLPEPIASKRETPLSHSFCKHVVQTDNMLIVEDARKDERLKHNLAIRDLNVIAYAGVPIVSSDGYALGSFCAIDTAPRQWTERDIRILKNLTASVVTEIELRNELSKRQQVENILQASELKFQQIAESANDAIIVLDENAKIIFINPATSLIFGYNPEELESKSIDYLTQSHSASVFQKLSLGLFTFKNNNPSWQAIRLIGQHKDGSDIPIEASLSQFSDQEKQFFTIIMRDVTTQVDVENELRASEARYLQVLDAIPDLIFVKDENFRVVWANQAFQDFFGVQLEQMVGLKKLDSIDDATVQDHNEVDVRVFRDKNPVFIAEEKRVRHDSVIREFTTTKTPIFDESRNVMLLVGISRDITDSKNLERYLTEALAEKQELVELKSGFTSMVSHEFRTPLSVIMSSTEILINYSDRLTEKRRYEKLETVREQVKRLTHLMNDVLVVGKGDAQGLPFNPSLHNVDELAYNIIEEVKIRHSKADVNIEYVYQGVRGLQFIDENLFRHIFQNLLSNAIKYSRPNTEVQTRINGTEDYITLIVVDEGIGIPEDNQKNLYNTFHRAKNVGTIQGTGLGLAIVKRAIDTHGGTINFKSIENQGTMFVVTLPTSDPNMWE